MNRAARGGVRAIAALRGVMQSGRDATSANARRCSRSLGFARLRTGKSIPALPAAANANAR